MRKKDGTYCTEIQIFFEEKISTSPIGLLFQNATTFFLNIAGFLGSLSDQMSITHAKHYLSPSSQDIRIYVLLSALDFGSKKISKLNITELHFISA